MHSVAPKKSQARAQDLCLPGQGALPHPADPLRAHPAPQARCIGPRRLAHPRNLGVDLVFNRRCHFLYAVLVCLRVCLPLALLEIDNVRLVRENGLILQNEPGSAFTSLVA